MAFAGFSGAAEHTLDDKGRLIIPSKFRAPLGEKFYLIRSINSECIWIMPEDAKNAFIERISSKISLTDVTGQNWLTRLNASVYEVEIDKQGRISIPQDLKKLARIDDPKVTLIGNKDHIEIWSTILWKKQDEEMDFFDQTKAVFEKYGI